MRWARVCIPLRSLFRFGNLSSSALHVMAGEMSACGMCFSLNDVGCQTQRFWVSNPMLFRFKPHAFGRQTQRCWNVLVVCFCNILCMIELSSISGFSAERFRVDASFSMLEQNKKSKEPSVVSSLSHEWYCSSKEDINFGRFGKLPP